MGSFPGHALPGTFFALMGLLSLYNLWMRWFACRRLAATSHQEKWRKEHTTTPSKKTQTFSPSAPISADPPAFYSSIAFRMPCCSSRPVSEWFVIACCVIGIIGEVATGFNEDGSVRIANIQHVTMYSGFIPMAVLLIMQRRRVPVPDGVEYVSLAGGFAMQALLFYYHLHGRPPMDVQVHMFLVYVCSICCISTLFEMKYRSSVLPVLCRSFGLLLQGTWFWQVGFILYPPVGEHWDEHDHHQMMVVTLIYAWHWILVGTTAGFIGLMAHRGVMRLSVHEVPLWASLEQNPDTNVHPWGGDPTEYLRLDVSDDEAC